MLSFNNLTDDQLTILEIIKYGNFNTLYECVNLKDILKLLLCGYIKTDIFKFKLHWRFKLTNKGKNSIIEYTI